MIHSLRSPRSSSSLTTSDKQRLRPDGFPPRMYQPLTQFSNRYLLPDTKATEDQIEDVVGSRCPGDLVERAQGVVEVEQEHFVRHATVNRGFGGIECGNRIAGQALVTDVGEEASFGLGASLSADVAENLLAQLGNSFAGNGGSPHVGQMRTENRRPRTAQIHLVVNHNRRPPCYFVWQFLVFGVARLGGIEHDQKEVGILEGLHGFADTDAFRFIQGTADAGSI